MSEYTKTNRILFLVLALLIVVPLIVRQIQTSRHRLPSGNPDTKVQVDLDASYLREVSYLLTSENLGRQTSYEKISDWAQGKRFRVVTNRDTYLFYFRDFKVVGIWTQDPRKQIYQRD